MTDLVIRQTTELQSMTLSEDLFQSFLSYLDASPKTVETYTKAIRQFYKYIEERGITQPAREDVIEYREALREDHKPTTVQNYITALRLFFQWTETAGLYPNIAQHIKGAKLTKEHKKDYLTSSQVKAILRRIDTSDTQGRRDFAIIALMVTGGLRDIEVSRANIEDLRTLGDSVVLYIQGKGREDRSEYVKVMPEVEKAIRATLSDRKNTEGRQPLFISLSNNSKGERISTRSISGIVKTSFRRAGYDSDRLTAHSLRHTAVTLSLLGGRSLQEAQQFARHTNISTTQIYAHNLDRAKNDCEKTIARAIF
jgi:integrase/recombinase XerC